MHTFTVHLTVLDSLLIFLSLLLRANIVIFIAPYNFLSWYSLASNKNPKYNLVTAQYRIMDGARVYKLHHKYI